jgi:hypothetical protein
MGREIGHLGVLSFLPCSYIVSTKYLCSNSYTHNTHTHKENIMSKTPYEIRLDLLKLANEILTTPVHNNRDALMQKFHASRETYVGEAGPREPMAFPELPQFPSSEDILKEAEKLKDFVDAG